MKPGGEDNTVCLMISVSSSLFMHACIDFIGTSHVILD